MGDDPGEERLGAREARVERLVAYVEAVADMVRTVGVALPPLGGGLNGQADDR